MPWVPLDTPAYALRAHALVSSGAVFFGTQVTLNDVNRFVTQLFVTAGAVAVGWYGLKKLVRKERLTALKEQREWEEANKSSLTEQIEELKAAQAEQARATEERLAQAAEDMERERETLDRLRDEAYERERKVRVQNQELREKLDQLTSTIKKVERTRSTVKAIARRTIENTTDIKRLGESAIVPAPRHRGADNT